MEKRYCDVEGCGMEIKDSGLARYSQRKIAIDLGGVPVVVEMSIWPSHKDVCPDCADKLPAMLEPHIATLLTWEWVERDNC